MSGLKRREFLTGTGAAALAAMTSRAAWALDPAAMADPVAAAFARGLAKDPWLLAFANVERESFAGEAAWIRGALPAGLSGSLYRNGPARHEIAGERYHHSFDGDGVIQAYRLAGGAVRHEARLIQTRKVALEREAGRRMTSGFGTPAPPGRQPKDNNEQNVANISVLWHADRLLALWEAGDAYAIDPDTLATRGPHHWSPETAGMPFSAHPRREPDGTLWNFGSVGWMHKLAIYRISKRGDVVKTGLVDVPHHGMIHDFAVTEKHLVFLIPPLLFEAGDAETFLARHIWHEDQPMRVLVVEKADLSKQRWLEAPTSFVFHLGNAWEEANGTIHLDFCRHPNADLLFGSLARVMWGETVPSDPATVTRMTIDPKSGRVTEDIGIEIGEFPSVDPGSIGRRHRHVVTLGRSETPDVRHPQFNSVVRHDLEGGAVQRFVYPASVLPEEHIVVPGPNGGAGWIVGTALDFEKRANQLAVFEAEHLEDGPIALARLPYWLPMGLHGRFVPA